MDVYEDEHDCLVKIIDYKSGSRELDLTLVRYGIQLQLLLYLDAAMEIESAARPGRRILPAGAFYFHIGDMWADMTEALKAGTEDPAEALLSQFCMTGYANGDPDILPRIDHALTSEQDVRSSVVPVKMKKGQPDSSSRILSSQEFDRLIGTVRTRIRDMGKQMLGGEVNLDPYIYGQKNACEWCPYRNICAFERSAPGFKYRLLKKQKQEDLLGTDGEGTDG